MPGGIKEIAAQVDGALQGLRDSASLEPVQLAIPHMPYPISLTIQPVRPNRR